jgi:hypothetical protein
MIIVSTYSDLSQWVEYGKTYVVQSASPFAELDHLDRRIHSVKTLVVYTRESSGFEARVEMVAASLLLST